MWKFYIEKFNQRMQVNLKNSLFCGDSAGRKFFSKFKSNDINDFDLYIFNTYNTSPSFLHDFIMLINKIFLKKICSENWY